EAEADDGRADHRETRGLRNRAAAFVAAAAIAAADEGRRLDVRQVRIVAEEDAVDRRAAEAGEGEGHRALDDRELVDVGGAGAGQHRARANDAVIVAAIALGEDVRREETGAARAEAVLIGEARAQRAAGVLLQLPTAGDVGIRGRAREVR